MLISISSEDALFLLKYFSIHVPHSSLNSRTHSYILSYSLMQESQRIKVKAESHSRMHVHLLINASKLLFYPVFFLLYLTNCIRFSSSIFLMYLKYIGMHLNMELSWKSCYNHWEENRLLYKKTESVFVSWEYLFVLGCQCIIHGIIHV